MIRSPISTCAKKAATQAHGNSPKSVSPQSTGGAVDLTKYVAISAACSVNKTNGMLYPNGGVLSADYLINIGTTKSWTITVYGSDSQAGTTGTVYIDGVSKGTFTFPSNGSAAVNGTVAGAAAVAAFSIPAGAHVMRISFSSAGSKPGIKQATFA